MNKDRDIVIIDGDVHHETDSAYLFSNYGYEKDGKTLKKFWLPKSQCEWDSEEGEMQMPEWLAIEKGLI